MYQFTGWIVVDEAPWEVHPSSLHPIVDQIRELVDSFPWRGDKPFSNILEIRWINGKPFVVVAGAPNHRRGEADDLEHLLHFIAERAPGSYGLIYVWDDEAQDWPGHNAFKVLVLARGKVTERADPFLSPIVPTVYDPEQLD
ncbi:hypothetical protein GCM10012275_60490 [Longimycelium tulufanense]|uniref:Immunity protein 7 of polymorphic toxin system n=1 Tax=Longimycelium tulufanense TaxID=907463 RepID=A0A8J3CE76_9PSEU|nr:Imm7 family immunity protein [Longimycelium tulufanense]GGM81777.1 hypothetical protein GCM10012275_60490 [Longimycelium tulufanense]